MIQTIDFRGCFPAQPALRTAIPRAPMAVAQASAIAEKLISAVRNDGVRALKAQAEQFDGKARENIRVSETELKSAEENLDPALRAALIAAIERVRLASLAQVPANFETVLSDGAVVRQRWQAVNRVGLYVPGGKAVYPSSVVMNAVAAQVAGVKSIVLVSPPQLEYEALPHPTILAAANLLGITEVYAMGGAGAIGALAYGVAELGLVPVDMVTGPGNVFVAAAKRLVRSEIGIDAEAGPTEILIIADQKANPKFVAADLLSQAEHDELAAAVLITDSVELADSVRIELAEQLAKTFNRDRASIALSGVQSAIVLVDSLAEAVALSNAYAPEHLSVQTVNAEELLPVLTNAGALFLGAFSPVSLGDYLAGSNHVLPTGGQARHSAGLSSMSFMRSQQIIDYSQTALAEVSTHIIELSKAEQLPAHGDAIAIRNEATIGRE